jgi:hypothetical protein
MSTTPDDFSEEYRLSEKESTSAKPPIPEPKESKSEPIDWSKTLPALEKPRYKNIKAHIISRD